MYLLKKIINFHSIKNRICYSSNSIKAIYIENKLTNKRFSYIIKKLKKLNIKFYFVKSNIFKKIVFSKSHYGIFAVVKFYRFKIELNSILRMNKNIPLFIILDCVKDPINLGSCLRSSNSAGVSAIISDKNNSVRLTNTVYNISCGASDITPYIIVNNILNALTELKRLGVFIIGTDFKANYTINEINSFEPISWIIGSENIGMRFLTSKFCDKIVRIPTVGSMKSLNCSIACSICLFDSIRQRLFKK